MFSWIACNMRSISNRELQIDLIVLPNFCVIVTEMLLNDHIVQGWLTDPVQLLSRCQKFNKSLQTCKCLKRTVKKHEKMGSSIFITLCEMIGRSHLTTEWEWRWQHYLKVVLIIFLADMVGSVSSHYTFMHRSLIVVPDWNRSPPNLPYILSMCFYLPNRYIWNTVLCAHNWWLCAFVLKIRAGLKSDKCSHWRLEKK